jgi:hypothetical protein
MRNPFIRKPSNSDLYIEKPAPSSPTIRFANLMLYAMSVSHTTSRVLRTSESLEPLQCNEETLAPPPLQQLTNRFKVMSGLNPVHYKNEVQGKIHLSISSKQYTVCTTFNDEIDEVCKIEFIEPNEEQNNPSHHTTGSRAITRPPAAGER